MKCCIKTNAKQILPDVYLSVSGLTMATENTKYIHKINMHGLYHNSI